MPRLLEPLWLIFLSLTNKRAAEIIECQREQLLISRGPKTARLTARCRYPFFALTTQMRMYCHDGAQKLSMSPSRAKFGLEWLEVGPKCVS